MSDAWEDACLAASLAAVDPQGLGGVWVRSRVGPVRDCWLGELVRLFGPRAPIRRVAGGVSAARLAGGLDLAETIARGRPVVDPGLLASVDGGAFLVAMAERLDRTAAGTIAAALDERRARFALIALDESTEDDEPLAPALADRLALRVDLDALSWREADRAFLAPDVAGARDRLGAVYVGNEMTEALCAAAMSLGDASLRTPLHLVRAARAAAALRGAPRVETEDAAAALRLVLGVRVRPSAEAEAAEKASASPSLPPDDRTGRDDSDAEPTSGAGEAPDMLLDAARAMLPKDMLLALRSASVERTMRGTAGRAGVARADGRRGRALAPSARKPVPDARIDIVATLREAAPWQRIRAGTAELESLRKHFHVRKDDFRYVRTKAKRGTAAIFAVDASGSAAVERLAEAKGAVELLLAECYVRRDSVALVAFRGRRAEALLEPTRSLVRAKRCLAALPGGGGTPLADGILVALRLALASVRKGQDAVVVFLTDGRGNVALDGSVGRGKVIEDLAGAARQFRKSGVRSILIDTARRPQPRAAELARNLGAEYLALPQAGARGVATQVGARMKA